MNNTEAALLQQIELLQETIANIVMNYEAGHLDAGDIRDAMLEVTIPEIRERYGLDEY